MRGRRTALCSAALALALSASSAAGSPRLAQRLASAEAPTAELVPSERTAGSEGGSIRRYAQRSGGLAVFDAELVVANPAAAGPVVVADSTVGGLAPAPRPVSVGRATAIRSATVAAKVARMRARPRTRLGIDPETRSPAWRVLLPAARPFADYQVTIDARSGRTLGVDDLLWRATGSAALFDPNPVVTQGAYAGLRDGGDGDSTLLRALRVGVSLPRISSERGCLVGPYADARLGKGSRAVCRPSLEFTDVERSNDRFEALMAYYHVDRTREYVESLDLAGELRDSPQRVRANGIRDDNSYYSPLTKSMTLGTGGVDDGEDADVIVHEYGHSLQDQAVNGFGRSVGAGSVGEGFGDYMAATMSALTTGGDSEFDACIFDWDAVSYSRSGCGRRADRALGLVRAKRRCGSEIHCLGEAWSSALYELRALLGDDAQGRSVGDRIVLQSNFLLARRSGFRDAARALLAADQLLYAGAHRAQVEGKMSEREICPAAGC